MRTLLALVLALAAPSAAAARPPAGADTAWSPLQATGAPDATPGQDDPKAWASQEADGGEEWLEVDFEHTVDVREIRIVQSFNPGALTRIEVVDSLTNRTQTAWEGTDGARPTTLRLTPDGSARTRRLRIHLDTRRVPGWNEIDAVGIVGTDGEVHWASSARASSAYGGGGGPFARLVGVEVRLTHTAGTVEGRLVGLAGDLIEIERNGGRTIFVSRAALVTLEAK